MMSSRFRNFAAALLSLVVASACGSDSASSPIDTPATGGTLADAIAQLSLPSLGSTAVSSTGLPNAIPVFDPAKCAYTASSQSFVCAPVTTNNLTFTQSYALLDASGNRQTAFGPTTTSAIHASTTISGIFTDGPVTIGVDGKQDLTLSGLLTSVHTLDGTGTTKLTQQGGALGAQLGTVVTSTIDKLTLPANASGASALPTSGSVAVRTTTLGTNAVVFDLKLTFIGAGKATVVITAGGTTQTCTLNLASPGSSCQ